MGTVELRPAYVWDCPECGRETFENGLVTEISPEEELELMEEHGQFPSDGIWMMMPQRVYCEFCDLYFQSEHFGES